MEPDVTVGQSSAIEAVVVGAMMLIAAEKDRVGEVRDATAAPIGNPFRPTRRSWGRGRHGIRVYAACAETPDGFVVALAQDRTSALHELLRLSSGHAQPTSGWVLPPITFEGLPPDFQPGVSNASDYGARMVAWAAARACLPAGFVPSRVDKETVGPSRIQLCSVTAHLSGEIAATATWTSHQPTPADNHDNSSSDHCSPGVGPDGLATPIRQAYVARSRAPTGSR